MSEKQDSAMESIILAQLRLHPVPETALAYLAGFFDGEGCINITVRGKVRQVVLRIMIVNTDLTILNAVQQAFGGYVSTRLQKNPTWKPFSRVTLSGMAAFSLLELLAPYLVIKQPQVRLALRFRAFQQTPKNKRCSFVVSPTKKMPNRTICTRTPETLSKELEFKKAMHVLNRKGVA